ncbi:hypothetical protein [Enterococcus phage PEF7b]
MLIKKEKKAYLFTIYGLHSYPFVIGVGAYSDAVAMERFYKIWRKHYPKHYKKHKEFTVKKFDI